MAAKLPEGSQYDKMPPPRSAESAPIQKSEPNAWSASSTPVEDRIRSSTIGTIKKVNEPEAQKETPSLKGRVSLLSTIIDVIKIPFVAFARLVTGLFSNEKKKEEDLSYNIDVSDFEEQTKELEATANDAIKGKELEQSKLQASKLVDEFAEIAGNQQVKINLLKLKNNSIGDLFEADKANLDTAIKDFRNSIENAKSEEDIEKLLNPVEGAVDRLTQTFEVEQKRV